MIEKKPVLSQHDKYFDLESHKMYVAVDSVIFGFDGESLKLLLMKRSIEPYAGQWSLIGSFVKLEENLEEAAQRILYERTGLKDIFLEQSKVYGAVDRDPGYRCLSVVFSALIRSDSIESVTDAQHFQTQWFEVEQLPDLVLDHLIMVKSSLSILQSRAKFEPFVFELLPLKFTIPQLQKLFESLLQKNLDNGNFRKKIISYDILKDVKQKDKSGSKRGAWLYEFDPVKYQTLISKGRSMIF